MPFLDLEDAVAEEFESAQWLVDPRRRRWDPSLRSDTWTSRNMSKKTWYADETRLLKSLRRVYVIEPTKQRWTPRVGGNRHVWTDAEERYLVDARLRGDTFIEIAEVLHTTTNSTYQHFKAIYDKLELKPPSNYTISLIRTATRLSNPPHPATLG